MGHDQCSELERFEQGQLDPKCFGHSEHVRIAYELLSKERFVDALPRFARGIRAMAARAGAPQKYNETITTAFLAMIAEQMQLPGPADYEEFRAANPSLFDKDALLALYSRDRLYSPQARATFLLPQPRFSVS